MRLPLRPLSIGIGLLALAACAGGLGSIPATNGQRDSQTAKVLPATSPTPTPSSTSLANTHIKVNTKIAVIPDPNPPTISGYTPQDLWSAYNLSAPAAGAAANGRTIAIIDAYDDLTAESDLAVYRTRFGLPPCTTANGCFRKLNQNLQGGGVGLPPANPLWDDEIALDLAMASTACPTCKLTLVIVPNTDPQTFASAVNKVAQNLRPAAISNSYGTPEDQQSQRQYESSYDHPGIAITASAGDSGIVEFPASSRYVISVSGTTLQRDSNSARGWSETGWQKSGGGCSTYFSTGSWQNGNGGCSGRAVADVAFDADTDTGVAVFSTAGGGWMVLGGTSAGAPFVAGLFANAGDYGSTEVGAQHVYAHSGSLFPVGKQNGSWKSKDAALGSPNGLTAF